jgi:CBS domain-containing protein
LEGLIQVGEVMVTAVKTVSPEESIREVVAKMNKFRIGSVMVVDRDRPVGIITQGNILRKVVEPGLDLGTLKARRVMTTPLHTIESQDSMEQAARAMVKWNVKRLPVTKNGRLAGIVTTTDLIRSTPALIGLLQEFIRARYVPPELRTGAS